MTVESSDITRAKQAKARIDAAPYARFLQLSLTENESDVLVTLPYRALLVGNPRLPALHGGAVASLLEAAAIIELVARAGIDTVPELASITIDYLRTAEPSDTHASASVMQRGKHVATLHVVAWQHDRTQPIATASAHLVY